MASNNLQYRSQHQYSTGEEEEEGRHVSEKKSCELKQNRIFFYLIHPPSHIIWRAAVDGRSSAIDHEEKLHISSEDTFPQWVRTTFSLQETFRHFIVISDDDDDVSCNTPTYSSIPLLLSCECVSRVALIDGRREWHKLSPTKHNTQGARQREDDPIQSWRPLRATVSAAVVLSPDKSLGSRECVSIKVE